MEYFFTADCHFGHQNIIRHCNRPFGSAEEMDEILIQNWNNRVSPTDMVYHLGDFAFRPAEAVLKRLNGRIFLIQGNHDKQFQNLPQILFIKKPVEIVLCHYPMLAWPKSHRGAMHFYGHVHGRIPPTERSCDVGVDCWGYEPVTLEEIKNRLDKCPIYML